MSSRIEAAFAAAKRVDRCLFFPELLFGYPNMATSRQAFACLCRLEHVVFKVPTPVRAGHPSNTNQTLIDAHRRAIENGLSARACIHALAEFRPNMLVVYPQAIDRDVRSFLAECRDKVDSLIFVEGIAGREQTLASTGVPPTAAAELAAEYDIDVARIVYAGHEQTFSEPVQTSRGFVYLAVASQTGGEIVSRDAIARSVDVIKKMRDIPILAGFGLGRLDRVARVSSIQGVDGITVGNWLYRSLQQGLQQFCQVVDDVYEVLGPDGRD